MEESEKNRLKEVVKLLAMADSDLRQAIVLLTPLVEKELGVIQNARQFLEEARSKSEELLKAGTP